MLVASLRIQLPAEMWITAVSQEFPTATFRLLSGIRTGETAVELGEVVARDPAPISTAIEEHPAITEYQPLERDAERSLAKYTTTDTDLYAFIEAESVPPEFPVVVQNGWYELDFTGTREVFDGICDTLDASNIPYELQSLVETPNSEESLTTRQREVLETAVRMGYFEVPRDCTLADLGAALDVDKSSVSTTLRRAEAALLKQMLTGAAP